MTWLRWTSIQLWKLSVRRAKDWVTAPSEIICLATHWFYLLEQHLLTFRCSQCSECWLDIYPSIHLYLLVDLEKSFQNETLNKNKTHEFIKTSNSLLRNLKHDKSWGLRILSAIVSRFFTELLTQAYEGRREPTCKPGWPTAKGESLEFLDERSRLLTRFGAENKTKLCTTLARRTSIALPACLWKHRYKIHQNTTSSEASERVCQKRLREPSRAEDIRSSQGSTRGCFAMLSLAA